MVVHPFRFRTLLAIFAVALLSTSALLAQTNYGGVRGLASDATGAVVAGASVTLTDESTNISRTAVTTSAGEYTFTAVDPGTYTVTIVAPGFTKLAKTHVSVTIGVTSTVDMPLKTGSAAETVEVTADVPLIDTASASNGQTFDQQKLQTLPNMGRNPFLFAKLDTNVTFTGDPRFVRFQDQSGSSQISIAGGPTGTNNYLLDGVPITDSTNRAVIIPSLEATGEMKIQANTFDAEMGRTGGGMFNTSLKSGSNTLHGSLLGLTRQTNWTANSWAYNRTPYVVNGVTVAPQTPRGAAEWYSYAGSLGGPVRIPFLYNGKDRTFFWVTEEGYRQRSPLSSTGAHFPTALERTGDFSQSGITLYDPYKNPTGTNRTEVIPNAKIPSSYLSPAGLKIVAALPLPTTVSQTGNNTFGNDTLGDRADEFSLKLDHQVTKWWGASASYLHYGSKEPSGNVYQIPYSTANLLYRKVDAVNVTSVVTLSPTMILNAGWGFNRFPNQTNRIHTGYDQTQLFPSAYVSQLSSKTFPTITTSGGTSSVLGGSDSGPSNYFSRSFVVGLSKSYGKHTFKTGYVFRSISNIVWSTSSGGGSFTFTGGYTNRTNVASTLSGRVGSDIADLLMGLPNSASLGVTPGAFQFNTKYNAVYFQDDFRVNQRLTVNAGIRLEMEPGFHEANNKLTIGIDPLAIYNYSTSTGTISNLRGGVQYAGVKGAKTYTSDYSSLKLAPRIGIAYGILPKMTVRGGFGIFFAPSSFSPTTSYSPGYAPSASYAGPSGVTALVLGPPPLDAPQNLYSASALVPSGSSLGYAAGIGGSLSFIDPSRRSPFVYQYSADLQYELPAGFALKLGYVGAHGRNLANSFNYNQLSTQARTAAGFPYEAGASTAGAGLANTVTNPYYLSGGNGLLNRTAITRAQSLRPFPQFTDITYASSLGGTRYNSMAVKLQKRFTNGVTMMATYTWASSWDNLWGSSSSLTSSGAGPQDTGNLSQEWARSTTGSPRRFTLNGSYELPFGRGRKYLASSRLLDIVVGGWNYNHVMILQSGSPLAATQTSTSTDAGYGAQRPTFAPGENAYSVCQGATLLQRLSASKFTTTAPYAYGNVPRTLPCQGPGYFNNDISVNKRFKATEKVTLEFRAEALNAFNTVQLAAPGSSNITNSSFGTINSQVGFNRLIQMGGKVIF